MQMCESSHELLAGDPQCAPATAVMVEANISLIRTLHRNEVWAAHICEKMLQQLGKVKELITPPSKSRFILFVNIIFLNQWHNLYFKLIETSNSFHNDIVHLHIFFSSEGGGGYMLVI